MLFTMYSNFKVAPKWLIILSLFLFFSISTAQGAVKEAVANEGVIVPVGIVDTGFQDAVSDIFFHEDDPNTTKERHQNLLNQAEEWGPIPVIVRLKISLIPEARLDIAGANKQRETLAEIQQRVLNRLAALTQSQASGRNDDTVLGIKRFTLSPAFAIHADGLMLSELLADPDVLDIVEDRAEPPILSESVPLIGADSSGTFAGRTGQGWVVAILDTGVDKTHPFLNGKVVSEACYSGNYAPHGASSLCPGGVTSSTDIGSGLDCSTTIRGCGHGTHVAGIAAGKGISFSGVARDASVIAIKVFSRFDSTTYCGSSSPCVLAYQSDIINGLEQVYALRTNFNIASANMSLGDGRYFSHCDSDTRKPSIDQLRSVGIATTVASGNNSYTDSISAPACISTAVSVGSTTKSDIVSSFSNSAGFLNLLAPGSSISSSVPGGGYEAWSGTSMATPHAAGAWAVLKQAKSGAGVTEILNALILTGKPIIDTREGGNLAPYPEYELPKLSRLLLDRPP